MAISEEQGPEQIKDRSRREILRTIALSVTAATAGPVRLDALTHATSQPSRAKMDPAAYSPKSLNPHEYATVERLTELIVPADDVSRSAKEAGAPEFIDLLCSSNPQLADIYTGGLAWLDSEMRRRHGRSFLEARAEEQTAFLDALVDADRKVADNEAKGLLYRLTRHYEEFGDYEVQPITDLGPGIHFFTWIRKMTVDAFYTSEMGIRDVGFKGNQVLTKYEVPPEAIEYALRRSPFGK